MARHQHEAPAEAPVEIEVEAFEAAREITIQGAVFLIPNRYNAGHVMSKGEADALNQTFAENIRNNVVARAKKAADTVAEGDEASVEITQESVSEYALSYVFGVRKTTARVVKNPIEIEERRLARQAVHDAVKAKGLKLKDVADETMENYIVAAINTGKFRLKAESIVSIKSGSTEGLDLDL